MKLFILAGEASGDLHGSNLIKALLAKAPDTEIQAWGGDLMEAAGATIVKHYRELAFMGFAEVLMNIRTIRSNFKRCRADIEAFAPDAVVMIDYPGFNLRIAPFIKKKGIPIVYYISPQIWAWKQSRIHQIKILVDKMLVILPFEKDFYKRFGMDVEFVGHPLIDAIHSHEPDTETHGTTDDRPLIALLPGSRKQEIKKILPLMLESVASLDTHQAVIAGAPGIDDEFYQPFLSQSTTLLSRAGTYEVLKKAEAALVTSGTATLESALLKVPEVVCYKGNYLSYLIAKRLVKVKYISLVNLIMDKEIVKELIQNNCNTIMINKCLNDIISTKDRDTMLQEFNLLEKKLGGVGASEKAALAVLKTLKESDDATRRED